MSTWRYVQAGQTLGPVETPALVELLRGGALPPDTLVWKGGMPAWVPASTVPDLSGGAPPGADAQPSPPPIGTGVPPPLQAPLTDAADIEKNKVFAVLAYISLLFLVPLLAAPDSRFARYHTNQGIVLFLATLAVCGGSMVLVFVPIIGCIAAILPFAGMLAAAAFMILGIINAASGQCKPLPLIGHFELLK